MTGFEILVYFAAANIVLVPTGLALYFSIGASTEFESEFLRVLYCYILTSSTLIGFVILSVKFVEVTL